MMAAIRDGCLPLANKTGRVQTPIKYLCPAINLYMHCIQAMWSSVVLVNYNYN